MAVFILSVILVNRIVTRKQSSLMKVRENERNIWDNNEIPTEEYSNRQYRYKNAPLIKDIVCFDIKEFFLQKEIFSFIFFSFGNREMN